MRRTIITAFVALLALAVASSPTHAQVLGDLGGTWIVTSWESADGEVNSEPQRGLFVFAVTRPDGGSYSMMYVNTAEPRPRYEGDELTDEEKLRAYDSLTANSGRFTIEGNQLTWEAYVAKDPNYMADWEENGQTADIETDGRTLTLSFTSGVWDGMKATFRRPMAESN
jgi:hypothetical protein